MLVAVGATRPKVEVLDPVRTPGQVNKFIHGARERVAAAHRRLCVLPSAGTLLVQRQIVPPATLF